MSSLSSPSKPTVTYSSFLLRSNAPIVAEMCRSFWANYSLLQISTIFKSLKASQKLYNSQKLEDTPLFCYNIYRYLQFTNLFPAANQPCQIPFGGDSSVASPPAQQKQQLATSTRSIRTELRARLDHMCTCVALCDVVFYYYTMVYIYIYISFLSYIS